MSEEAELGDFAGDTPIDTGEIRSSLDETSLGEVPEDWQKVRLEDIVYESSYGASESAEDYDPEKPRYVRITDINPHGRLKSDTKVSLSREKAKGHLLKEGDLLFARSGASVGKTYLHRKQDGDCAYAGYLIRQNINEKVLNPEFLYQYTDSPRYDRWVARIQRTGAQPNINAQEYGNLLIPYPPLPEQQKIATVLHNVDQAIQKTEQIIEQSGRVKKGVIQEKILERISKPSSPTALGEVPDDWGKVRLEDIANKQDDSLVDGPFGSSLKAEEFGEDGFARILQLQNVEEGRYSDSNIRYVDKETFDELERHSAKPGDLFIAKMASPVARACILPDKYERYMLGCADVVKLTPNEEFVDEFVMYCLNSYPVWKQAAAHIRGSGRLRVNLNQLKQVELPKPPRDEQEKIVTAVSEITAYIDSHKNEKQRLQRLKQGLMQDLLSGTVRITDTNITVPEEIA